PTQMIDYIKQVFITGDVSCIGTKDDDLRRWSSEVAKEIAEQKPEFAVVHVQGLHSADDPDYISRVIISGIIDIPEIHKHFDSSVAFFDTSVTMTFVNLNLHSVPFEDVNEIVEQVQVTKAARKRNEEIETLLRELEAEGLRDDAIIVGGAFNAQLHETDLLT
ncbi:hypothetical protein TELCIR_16161, partial [Teladorsagia circumcincta]